MQSLYDFWAVKIDGSEHRLADYAGQVVLVVNVASRCGFTSQYKGLEALYRTHGQAGFTILGFPCDQFAHQEPGDAATIQQFCDRHYHVTFPLYAKIQVNGVQAHPLYQWLKQSRPGIFGTLAIKWNFTKFLVSREGRVLKRYAPYAKPAALTYDIQAACTRGRAGPMSHKGFYDG